MAKITAIKKLKSIIKLSVPKVLVPIALGLCLLTIGIVLPSRPTSLKKNPYDTNLPHDITVPKVTKLTVVPKSTSTHSSATTSPAPTPKPATTSTSSGTSSAGTSPAPATAPSPGTGISGLSSSSSGSGNSNSSGGSTQSSSTSNASPAASISYSSENWSGYLTTSGNFSTVSASWIVPPATSSGSSVSADATWIGIGGVVSDDLIQVGTQNTVEPGGEVSSSAFYELLPSTAQNITSISISAGNDMSAALSEISAGEWAITITNETNNETFSTDVAYSSSDSSAEWIEEDPSYVYGRLVPFDNFGSVSFTNCLTTDSGVSENISASSGDPVTMVNSLGQAVATPSALVSGGSFSVSRQNP